MPRRTPNRRQFLKTSAAATLGVWVAHQDVFAVQPTNEKLRIAIVGCQGQGKSNVKGVAAEEIVAMCDIDERNMDKAATEFAPKAKRYTDWRQLMDDEGTFDAVVCSTPDHTHAHVTLAALALRKHVYCEKPLTHTVNENRIVMNAARKAKVATQMGTQIHAMDNYRRVVELLQSGAIGAVKRIHVWVGTSWHASQRPQAPETTPSHVHWDNWLGPAPVRPYSAEYHPFKWRRWWDFSNGSLGDMACHHMDLSHWAFDLRYPQSIESEGPELHPDSPPPWQVVHYHYPAGANRPPIHLSWYHGEKRPPHFAEKTVPAGYAGGGSLFEGEKGMLIADYGKHALLPEEQFKDFVRPEKSIPASIGHHAEWIKACKEGTPTTCNFDYSGPLSETVLLGCVAYKARRKITWDPDRLTTGSPDADRFLTKEYRKGWELPKA